MVSSFLDAKINAKWKSGSVRHALSGGWCVGTSTADHLLNKSPEFRNQSVLWGLHDIMKCRCSFHTCTQPSPCLRKPQNDADGKSGLRECGEAEVEDPLYFLTASILDMICRYGSVQQVLPGSFHTASYLRKWSTAGRRLAFCCTAERVAW
jgi:hypothetical protein